MNAKEIIKEMESGKILPDNIIENLDIDSYLDKRDEDEVFESQLISASVFVEDINNIEIIGLDELSQFIFKKINGIVGTTELSCCISEDFEIILKSKFKGSNSDFINGMLSEYRDGKLPNA